MKKFFSLLLLISLIAIVGYFGMNFRAERFEKLKETVPTEQQIKVEENTVAALYKLTSADCQVKGIIEHFKERKVSFGDEDYRIKEGLPEFQTYYDLTLNITHHDYIYDDQKNDEAMIRHAYNCDIKNTTHTYQLPLDQKNEFIKNFNPETPAVGQCIEGTAFFAQDEFAEGTWLYDIALLPIESCATQP